MYSTGESVLKRILQLVEVCPKELQEKCFEILLAGYVQQEAASKGSTEAHREPARTQAKPPDTSIKESDVPATVLPRFKNTAKRIGVQLEKLEALFDFGVDPFALHALTLSGKHAAEKTRQVALLAASRSYLASGSWTADWQEIKSLCVDHSCYDMKNHAMNLKVGLGTHFKSVTPGNAVELSSDGIKEAEKLLKTLAEGNEQ